MFLSLEGRSDSYELLEASHWIEVSLISTSYSSELSVSRFAKGIFATILVSLFFYSSVLFAHAWQWCSDIDANAGLIKAYHTDEMANGAWSSSCNPNNYDGEIFADDIFNKYYSNVTDWASEIRAHCDGSLWPDTVDWQPPSLDPPYAAWVMFARYNGGPVEAGTEAGVYCSGGYFVALPQPSALSLLPSETLPDLGNACSKCKAPTPTVGHPIDPGSGNEYESKTDFMDGYGGLSFIRSYNSGSVVSSALGANWQHNYAAHIGSLYNSLGTPLPGMSYVSDVYDTAADACVSGWSTIAPSAAKAWPATAGAIASYDSATDTCNLSTGQTLAVYNSADTAATVLSTSYEPNTYAALAITRSDGSVYNFFASMVLVPPTRMFHWC